MKKLILLTSFALLTTTIFWSCEKEVSHSSDTEITLRGKKNNKKGGNGGNGGGDESPSALFEVVYDGSVIVSNEDYHRLNKSTRKQNILQSDCGDLTMTQGLNEVFNAIGITGCYTGSICGDSREIRQYDKKFDPQGIAAHFGFVDPVNGSNVFLTFHGNIVEENANGEYSIFPLSSDENDDIIITLDRWRIRGLNPSCLQEEAVTFSSLGLPDQSITIKLLNSSICPANPTSCGE